MAASAELATAWVTIVPSLKGASRQIEEALGGVPVDKPGRKIGKEIGKSIGKNLDLVSVGQRFQDIGKHIQRAGDAISGVGSSLTNYITKPALGAATAVGGIVTALGFKRLIGLENATQQLKGLGYSAEDAASIIQGPVLDAVKGTAFGIAEAGAAASGFIAGGMTDLEDLSRHLTLVGDMAAFSGKEYNHMAEILSRVAAEGRVTGGDLTQMGENGVFAAAALAEHLNLTQEEVRDLAAAGLISADVLVDALENQIGGSALAMGDTFTGTLRNVSAAIGRFGEKVWKDVFPKIKDTLQGFIDFLDADSMAAVAERIGEQVALAFERVIDTVTRVIDWWRNLDSETQKMIGKFALAAVAAGPFLKIFGSILSVAGGVIAGIGGVVQWLGKMGVGAGAASGGLGGLIGKFARFAGPVGLAVAALIQMWQSSEGFREAVIGLGLQLWELVTAVGSMLGPALSTIGELFGEVATAIGDFLGPVITWLTEAIAWAMPFILSIVEGVIANIVGIFSGLADVILGVVNLVKAIFTGDWAAAWEAVKQIVLGAVEAVWNFIQVWIVGRVLKAVTGFASLLRGLWSGLWNGIRSLTSTVVSGIQNLISAGMNFIRSIISNILGAIRSLWTSTWNGIRSFFSSIWAGLRSATSAGINGVMNFVRQIPSKIRSVFSNAGSWLLSAGKNIIQGLIRGITGAVKGAVDAVKNAVGSVISGAKSMLGIKSPSRVFRDEVGAMIGAGLAEGIDRSAGLVDRATGRLVDVPSVPGFAAGAPVVAAGSSGGSSVDVLARLADVLEGLPEDIRAGLLALFEVQAGRSQRDERVR